ncbi:MAG: DPP IV N-terminal domain-containing protein [bacterium]
MRRLRFIPILLAGIVVASGCGTSKPQPASAAKDAELLVRHEGRLGIVRDGSFDPLRGTEDKELARIALADDGRRVAAITSENRLCIFSPGKTDFRFLADEGDGQDSRFAPGILNVALLPDEERLLVQTYDTVFDLYDLKGKWISRLLDTSPNALSLRCPIWSPDGKQLAFIAGDDLWVADRKTDSLRQLTSTRAVEDDPAWSPDGLWIFFSSDMDARRVGRPDADAERDVYRMRPNGLNLQRLTTDPGEEARPLPWGPDSVLFARRGTKPCLLKLDIATGEQTEIASGEFDLIGFVRM